MSRFRRDLREQANLSDIPDILSNMIRNQGAMIRFISDNAKEVTSMDVRCKQERGQQLRFDYHLSFPYTCPR